MNEDIIIVKPVEQAFFPLDEQLGLEKGSEASPGLKKEMARLSAIVTYSQVQETLERIGQIKVSQSQIWSQTQAAGEKFQAREQAQNQAALNLPKRNESAVIKTDPDLRLGGSLDGGMMYIREEGWKEFKAGCIYQIETEFSYKRKTQAWEAGPHARDNTYVAHLGEPDPIGQLLWAEAQRRGWNEALDTQFVADGAKWIWRLVEEHFYDSVQTVDWYHACSYLSTAAKDLYPDQDHLQARWLKAHTTCLYQGHAQDIADTLFKEVRSRDPALVADLKTAATYFDNNHQRMDYLALREQGYLIGSGTVESGIKQFKARFCGAGMRWSRPGAERMLALRSAVLSDHFDLYWDQIHNSPLN